MRQENATSSLKEGGFKSKVSLACSQNKKYCLTALIQSSRHDEEQDAHTPSLWVHNNLLISFAIMDLFIKL